MHGRNARITRMAFGLRMALGIGITITLVAPPAASAAGHRLYRHRSGYLFGASRPCPSGAPRYDPYYGGSGYGAGGGQDPNVDYARRDFDTRRDRLLDHAARIDVSYLHSTTGSGPARTQPVDTGWVFLSEGEPVKALGKFTARIMLAPGDAQARIGFALAAALLDDERAAAQSMRTAVRFDVAVLRTLASDKKLDDKLSKLLHSLLTRLQPEEGTLSPDARFLVASMHGLLGEPEAGLLVLDDLGTAESDSSTKALCAALADDAETALASSAQ